MLGTRLSFGTLGGIISLQEYVCKRFVKERQKVHRVEEIREVYSRNCGNYRYRGKA